MKKDFLIVGLALLISLLISCASSEGIYRPLSEEPGAENLGPIKVHFESLLKRGKLNHEAYVFLFEEAKNKFSGNIDVREITWYAEGGDIYATGFVVRLNPMGKVEGTLARAAEQIMTSIQPSSKIAIVYVSSSDPDTTEFIANELEYIMVNEGFTIIDRNQLDKVRREQNFQLSGVVDDETAVSIGKIVGANIIITGTVTGTDSTRRLRLRALNTQTAQVMAVASERL
ncbi:MAG: CsgG/HfaB family protein [Treponema sp.]|nr:CsgG/HfaB family protein [Treponema sp.]